MGGRSIPQGRGMPLLYRRWQAGFKRRHADAASVVATGKLPRAPPGEHFFETSMSAHLTASRFQPDGKFSRTRSAEGFAQTSSKQRQKDWVPDINTSHQDMKQMLPESHSTALVRPGTAWPLPQKNNNGSSCAFYRTSHVNDPGWKTSETCKFRRQMQKQQNRSQVCSTPYASPCSPVMGSIRDVQNHSSKIGCPLETRPQAANAHGALVHTREARRGHVGLRRGRTAFQDKADDMYSEEEAESLRQWDIFGLDVDSYSKRSRCKEKGKDSADFRVCSDPGVQIFEANPFKKCKHQWDSSKDGYWDHSRQHTGHCMFDSHDGLEQVEDRHLTARSGLGWRLPRDLFKQKPYSICKEMLESVSPSSPVAHGEQSQASDAPLPLGNSPAWGANG